MTLGLGIGLVMLAVVVLRQSRRLAQAERELEVYRREVADLDKIIAREGTFKWLRGQRRG